MVLDLNPSESAFLRKLERDARKPRAQSPPAKPRSMAMHDPLRSSPQQVAEGAWPVAGAEVPRRFLPVAGEAARGGKGMVMLPALAISTAIIVELDAAAFVAAISAAPAPGSRLAVEVADGAGRRCTAELSTKQINQALKMIGTHGADGVRLVLEHRQGGKTVLTAMQQKAKRGKA